MPSVTGKSIRSIGDPNTMDERTAILAFSQSEKIKAGILGLSQSLEVLPGIPEKNRKGAEKIARTFLAILLRDVHLSKRVTQMPRWEQIEKHIDMALVMLDSGVAHEAAYHLTRALSEVTSIGQRSMAALQEKGLL
jgi:hypothetical protein